MSDISGSPIGEDGQHGPDLEPVGRGSRSGARGSDHRVDGREAPPASPQVVGATTHVGSGSEYADWLCQQAHKAARDEAADWLEAKARKLGPNERSSALRNAAVIIRGGGPYVV